MEDKSKWIDIGQREKREGTERAIQINFPTGYGIITDHWKWIPKSCYRERMEGVFLVQEIKAWFYYKEQLYKYER